MAPPILNPVPARERGLATFWRWLASLLTQARPTPLAEEDSFAIKLLTDLAQHLAVRLELEPAIVADELITWRTKGEQNAVIRHLLRVDCTVEKTTASRIKLSLRAAWGSVGNAELTTLTQELNWDDLPRGIRRDFNLTGERELHYVVCPNQDQQRNSPTPPAETT